MNPIVLIILSVALTSLGAYAVGNMTATHWHEQVPSIVVDVAKAKEQAKGNPLLEGAVRHMEDAIIHDAGAVKVEALLTEGKLLSQESVGTGLGKLSPPTAPPPTPLKPANKPLGGKHG